MACPKGLGGRRPHFDRRQVSLLSELVEQFRRCARASDIPILVDGHHGYGNAINVMRTELDAAQAAGVTIEDTDLPVPFGSARSARLLSREEATAKIAAAVVARGASDFSVIARTSMTDDSGLDEVIAACRSTRHSVWTPCLFQACSAPKTCAVLPTACPCRW